MPKKPQRKFKQYMSKASVMRPAIEAAIRSRVGPDAVAKALAAKAATAAVKELRAYDRWLARGGD